MDTERGLNRPLGGTVKLSRICPFCGRILLDQTLIINDLAVAAGGENAAKLLNLTVSFSLLLCRCPHGCLDDEGASADGIVKLRLRAVFDAQHGGFETGWSPISWGSIDELFVNLTMPLVPVLTRISFMNYRRQPSE